MPYLVTVTLEMRTPVKKTPKKGGLTSSVQVWTSLKEPWGRPAACEGVGNPGLEEDHQSSPS